MCGLCGIIDFGGRDLAPEVATRMLDRLHHRGPDDRGMHRTARGETRSFLGHTRLSILDLSPAGRQPLSNETGTVWTVFNGEIYNFQELRTALEARGHRFRSKTDSEVIVHAYEEYGDDFVGRLDGMFAIALWDEERERLLLARDRTGKKPLYYYADGTRCVFASEIKALFAHPDVDRGIDPEAVPLYFTFGYVPCPGTMYRRVRQVPPASYQVVSRDGVGAPAAYWRLPVPAEGEERAVSEADATAEVRRLLEAAVARRLISDVPLGAFLSGGIDSSIVVGLMSRLMGRPVKTFSIGFAGDKRFDETAYARIVAGRFKTDHTEFIVEPKAFDLVEKLLWHHDQPYGDSSAIPTYLLCQLTREHVTVALNGDGGDELFAGYERFLGAVLTERLPSFAIAGALTGVEALPERWRAGRLMSRAHRLLARARLPLAERYFGWCSLLSRELLTELLLDPPREDTRRSFDEHLEAASRASLVNRLLYLNFHTYLPDDLLVKMDRMSMAHALEARSPFLDTALIEYVATLPGSYKLHGLTLKHLLKKAFADLLPVEIQRRGKMGFGVPLGTWFRRELKEPVREILLAGTPRSGSYLRREVVQRIFDQHQQGTRDLGPQLWTLLNFELWLRGVSA